MNPLDRQGLLGDLSLLPTETLEYLLKRQEMILANKALVRSLPDKGNGGGGGDDDYDDTD